MIQKRQARATTLLAGLYLAAAPLGAQEAEYDREIRRLAELPAVQRAFQNIESRAEEDRRLLVELTEIPAPPFQEDERARRYAELLREAGVDSVWIDAEGNVIGLRRGTGASDEVVAVDGHLDTVFPPDTDVSVRVRGDTLFAPGIGDDTQGLVLVLTVLRALNTADIETRADVLFIGTVGEEGLGDLRGVKHLFGPDGPGIDRWISIDGGGASRIAHRGVGSHRYRVTVKGPGGHSWGAFGLGNPHHALGEIVHHFVMTADPFTREGPRTSYNVGRIGGGTSVNSIPFESWMEVDMRSISPERLAGVDSIFQRAVAAGMNAVNALRREGPPLELQLDMVGNRPSGSTPAESPLVQRAMAATRYLGVEPELGTGSTNSNTPMSLGVPAITIGRGGGGGGAHSLGEWWVPEGVDLAAKKALLILLAEAGV